MMETLPNRNHTRTGAGAGPDSDFFLEADDVTGTQHVELRNVNRATPVSTVTRTLASRMSLPQNVPWALRRASDGAYLEDRPIGDQVQNGAKVTMTPRTHLGGVS